MEWLEICECKCRVNSSVCNNKQCWNKDKCTCECKVILVIFSVDVINHVMLVNIQNKELVDVEKKQLVNLLKNVQKMLKKKYQLKYVQVNKIKVSMKEGEYGKNFMKIKFDTDDNLLLNKPLKLHYKFQICF